MSHPLQPGTKYKFTAIQNIGRVSHTFKVPSAEKLDFVSFQSDEEPEPFRFPILVSDIEKVPVKQDQKREAPEHQTITVKNVTTNFFEKRVMPGNVAYHTPHEFDSKEINLKKGDDGNYRVNKDTYRMKVKPGPDGDITGGYVSVDGKREFVPEGKEASWKTRRQKFYLVQYKANVSSNTVDMSSGLDYQYDPDETVERTISLETYNVKLSGPVSEDDRAIWLKKDLGGHELANIYALRPFKKDGTWMVTLEAPPGQYQLYFSDRELEKNFTWPPDKN